MNSSVATSSRAGHSRWLAAGLLTFVFPLVGCSDDSSTGPEPTGVSIAPSSAAPRSEAPSPLASESVATPTSAPSSAAGTKVTTIGAAVAAAEKAVEDSTVVEVTKDDDDGLIWEITVRVGDDGRELRIDSADGSVLSNQPDRLDQSQLGDLPKVTVREAIEIAEKKVSDGEVTDAELSRERGDRVWDMSVDVGGGEDWELWIDASSGKVLREERD